MPRLKEAPAKEAGEVKISQPTLEAVPAVTPARVKAGAADDMFQSLDETVDFLKVLAYGREGTAKTTSLATAANLAPKGSRVLVVNAEAGLKKAALRRRGVDTSKIAIWPAPGQAITFRSLEALHERVLADLMEDPNSWFCVGIDSITEIHLALREQATGKRIKKQLTAAADPTAIDLDFIDRDDYGVMSNQLRLLVRRFRDLPCHVVLTALERVDNDSGVIGPALSPGIAGDVLGYVDLVLYFKATVHAAGEDDEAPLSEFRALTRPGVKIRAKDRFDLTPRVLAEPTFARIFGYITGDLDEETDPVQAAYVERRRQEAEAREAERVAREAKKAAASKRTGRASRAAGNDQPADKAAEGESA